MHILNLFHDRAMPRDDYVVRVSVDGVPIPEQSICRGAEKSVHCSFYVSGQQIQHRHKLVLCSKSLIHSHCISSQTRWWRTPSITAVTPRTGPPGTALYHCSTQLMYRVRFELQI